MVDMNPNLKASEPTSIFKKSLEIDYKGLAKGLTKGVSHAATGKWDEIANDTVETLASLGLATKPEELAYLLIQRAAFQATFELVGESVSKLLFDPETNVDVLNQKIDKVLTREAVYLERDFLERPGEMACIQYLQRLLGVWFEGFGIERAHAETITQRLPSYFIYALNQEWRKNAKTYGPLLEAIHTPFTQASERERGWKLYAALLQRRIRESIFDESFGLQQIYVPLNAYYQEEKRRGLREEEDRREDRQRLMVVRLADELAQWLHKEDPNDAMRVISGGPGSGKSTFARIFAADTAQAGRYKVLFVPLHLIDPNSDLVDEIGRFVRDEGVLIQNPLDPDSPEPNLVLILDGLDELASQGKIAADTARAFIREVERTVEKRNLQRVNLRVLISGRELVVQENKASLRRPQQILNLLPYWVPESTERKEFNDPKKLLATDLRQAWWKNYGILSGKAYDGLPEELKREDLDEITAQPLLNYLIALSFTRNKLDFNKDVNINAIYADLVTAVHERGYEKRRAYAPIRHMELSEFERVLEEIGLAAWHGDGRSTTVREIAEHCKESGVGTLLDKFKEGAEAGVTRLLAAFFFRQYGQRADGEQTFVFTHKSFGEYLAAQRIERAMDKMVRELERRNHDPDEGWDEREAARHWVSICGPSAISGYILNFLRLEIRQGGIDKARKWQHSFTKLFSYLLAQGSLVENISSFRKALFLSRNSEEALLAALNACALVTKETSEIVHPSPTAFGAWFKRIQGQRIGAESVLAARCLSFLNLEDVSLAMNDFFMANLQMSNLKYFLGEYGIFSATDFRNANLQGADSLMLISKQPISKEPIS